MSADDAVAVAVEPESPCDLRFALHFARARLLKAKRDVPGGKVTWADPLALVVQSAELRWGVLDDEQRAEGERGFLQEHGYCHLERCLLTRRRGK